MAVSFFGMLFGFFMEHAIEAVGPLVSKTATEQAVDQQSHQHAHAGIKDTVQGVADVGLHRGVEQHDAQ